MRLRFSLLACWRQLITHYPKRTSLYWQASLLSSQHFYLTKTVGFQRASLYLKRVFLSLVGWEYQCDVKWFFLDTLVLNWMFANRLIWYWLEYFLVLYRDLLTVLNFSYLSYSLWSVSNREFFGVSSCSFWEAFF